MKLTDEVARAIRRVDCPTRAEQAPTKLQTAMARAAIAVFARYLREPSEELKDAIADAASDLGLTNAGAEDAVRILRALAAFLLKMTSPREPTRGT